MNTQIATTPEQSRLIACGVNPDSADMMWYSLGENRDFNLYALGWEISRIKNRKITAYKIPAWSLSALLELLPMEIRKDGIDFDMMLKAYPNEEECYRWCISYYDMELEATAYYSEASDPIEACVKIVKKLTDNGYTFNTK